MTLTLTDGIGESDRELALTGDVPANIGPGFSFRLDDELLAIRAFVRRPLAYGDRWQDRALDRSRWRVVRSTAGSLPAAHEAGTEVLAAADAWVSSEDLTAPDPLVTSGGAASGITVLAVALTASQLKTLFSQWVEVIPAPAPGKAIQVIAAMLQVVPGVVPFTNDGGLLELVNDGGQVLADASSPYLSDLTARMFQFDAPHNFVAGEGIYDPAAAEAEPVLLRLASQDPDGSGDSTARLTVVYHALDLA